MWTRRVVGSVGMIVALCAAGSVYAQARDGLWGVYEAMGAPLLGEALGEAARHAPFEIRVGKWSAEDQGERVALKLPLYLERADAGAHQRALELLRLFAAHKAPAQGGELAPVAYWLGGQRHDFWVTPAALRIAGLSGEGDGRVMGERLALRVIWRDGQGRALAEQSASARVSASCAGLPVESVCRGCGEALELGARLTKRVEGQAVRAEVESCALEIEASVSPGHWSQTARVEVVLAGASGDAAPVVAVKEPGGRGLWPLAAASGVCAVSTRGGKQRELVSWRYDARGWPVEQRGWGTQTGQRRYVYEGERLVEVWDGAEQVERVVYDDEGRLLGTWTAQRRCGERGCEEVQRGRSVWVVGEDGQRERLEVDEAQGGLTHYTLERRAGRWEAVSARGTQVEAIHGALERQVLERESFVKLAARGEVRRLRVQASPRAGGEFDALVLGYDAEERPVDGVYVEHRRGSSRVAAIQIDVTGCHRGRASR